MYPRDKFYARGQQRTSEPAPQPPSANDIPTTNREPVAKQSHRIRQDEGVPLEEVQEINVIKTNGVKFYKNQKQKPKEVQYEYVEVCDVEDIPGPDGTIHTQEVPGSRRVVAVKKQ